MMLARLLRHWRASQAAETPLPDVFKRYAEYSRRLGLEGQYLFLSFDCDTDLDIDAVETVNTFLTERGIKATYAVPGAQLQRGAAVYRRLAAAGVEFMNHGGRPHAEWRDDRWVGVTFYNTMSEQDVVDDIRLGHEIVTDVIGQSPRGFRAPHFGCYNEAAQLNVLHRTAAALGYDYCSTTIPRYGLENGPAYATHGLIEFPCFGSFRNPPTILDSWTYLTDRKDYALGNEYYELFAETLAHFSSMRLPAVFTWYADPCHVLDQKPFHDAMDMVARLDISSLTGSQLTALLRPRLYPRPV